MFFSLRTLRGEPVDTPELRFMETAADVPVAIKSWWYAGDRQGYEFVYPRAQARLLAEGAGTPVLTTEAAPIEAKPAFEYITPETAVAPAAEGPVLIGEVAAAEEVEPALAQAPPATLPKTGSPTATLLLLGALALLSAGAVRAARRAQA
jgi:LPXTG-motif cell wall-anchored protein